MQDNNKIIDFPLDFLLGDRFGKYSKYIIQDRALPDVRDGLKPVQRRILYAMLVNGNVPSKAYRKSATAVGFVIGHYHPHGDTSVYDAMVRMSQWWKQNAPLIEMHGNNGSLDADPPAAMRYTEARLAPISMELLADIDRDTVNFAPNYDDSDQEPTVLPARFPHLLVNGSEGIAAGYRTNIPPHNFQEVCNATVYRLNNPDCSLEELMEIIPGPDFPTGGIVRGVDGIKDAFNTGYGQIQIVSKTEFVTMKHCIAFVITEIPFGVVKNQLVASIDKIRMDKEIDGILEVRDESDRNGLRIVVEMRKDIDVNSVKNYLMKKTNLTARYTYNTVVICDKQPRQIGIIPILDFYIKHQIDVINRRVKFDLKKAKARLHIVDGLIVAISNLDEVIRIIRASKSKDESKKDLMARFGISEIQAEAIVTLQLYRLNSADIQTLQKEDADLKAKIEDLESIQDNEKKIKKIIAKELGEIMKKYPAPRLSKIEDDIEDFTIEKKPILKEDVMVTISKDGYFKRSSLKSYAASEGANPGCKNGDIIVAMGKANTGDVILAFTDRANYLYVPVYELSDTKWKDEGKHISNLISLGGDEKIIYAINIKQFKDKISLVLCSKNGLIKRCSLANYEVQRYSKPVKAMTIGNDDSLVSVSYTDGDSSLLVLTRKGKAIHYHESKVNLVGVRASGVKAVQMEADDNVASMIAIRHGIRFNVAVITDKGGFKVFNPLNIGLTARLAKTSEIYKFYHSDSHYIIGSSFLVPPNKLTVLSTVQGSRELEFDGKTTPLGKSIRSSLLSDKNEVLTAISDAYLPTIDDTVKTFDFVEEVKKVNVKTEEDENQQTIFDYLDDL